MCDPATRAAGDAVSVPGMQGDAAEPVPAGEPQCEPARSIYKALVEEQKKRGTCAGIDWIAGERKAVLRAAEIAAERFALRCPTVPEIWEAERSAMGHADYATKFALGVAEAMRRRVSLAR